MRKIVAALFVSLDGVVESPDKWTLPYFNDEVWQVTGSGMAATDTLLFGRRTYEEFAAYWPSKTADDSPYADYINNTPKVVVSRTLEKVEWRNSSLINGDAAGAIAKLKRQPGKNITILGSATLVRSLLQEGLIDQLALLLYPVVLGTGKRLFEDWTDQMSLKLAEFRALSNGVVSVLYEPAGREGKGPRPSPAADPLNRTDDSAEPKSLQRVGGRPRDHVAVPNPRSAGPTGPPSFHSAD